MHVVIHANSAWRHKSLKVDSAVFTCLVVVGLESFDSNPFFASNPFAATKHKFQPWVDDLKVIVKQEELKTKPKSTGKKAHSSSAPRDFLPELMGVSFLIMNGRHSIINTGPYRINTDQEL